jgi:peptidoglycan hydrolase-like protein with peptidoglycan-binding domain
MVGEPRLLIFHSHSGPGTETAAKVLSYIERSWREGNRSVTIPHEHLDVDGARTQMLGWDRVGIASYRANPFSIAVETADPAGAVINTEPWTDGQLQSLAEITVEWHQRTGWPIERATAWDGHGVGYHSMWGQNTALFPNRNPWTNTRGKTCPGYARIAQFDSILEEARRIVAGGGNVWPFKLDAMIALRDAAKPDTRAFDSGFVVGYLQQVLVIGAGQNVSIDGVFDGRTFEAVRNVQRFFGLTVDGMVGSQTWQTIDWLCTNAVLPKMS